MKKAFFLVPLLTLGLVQLGLAENTNEPLTDYVAQFAKADALLRGIDSSTSSTNYFDWMRQAISAKEELKLKKEIDPWLEDLSTTCSNNWRILHAAAHGHLAKSWDENSNSHWDAVQLMDRAYRLMSEENPPPETAGPFMDDYVMILCESDEPNLLRLKTLGCPSADWEKQRKELSAHLRENPADAPMFYNLPTSYEAAANDGELARWLIQSKPPYDHKYYHLSRQWTLPDFAVLVAGSHINLPERWRRDRDKYADSLRKVFSNLKDDQTVVWGDEVEDYHVIELPADYRFIPAYERRALEGDLNAASILGNIFVGRCQLERAAHWYEVAGLTNEVRDIRANQGVLKPHVGHPHGLPVSADYSFRNGSEADFEVFPIVLETNLLARLIDQRLLGSELELLKGNAFYFQNFKGIDRPGMLGERLHAWTLPLSPLPDHLDTIQSVDVPSLDPGIYLLRASMKDGNQAETILYLYDWAVFSADFYEPPSKYSSDSGDENLFLACNALTGEPKPNQDLHFLKVSGGIQNINQEDTDGPHVLDGYLRKTTNENGVYTVNDRLDDTWNIWTTGNGSAPVIAGTSDWKLSVSSPSRERNEHEWDGDPDPFIATDRPIYRPGDTGHLKIWCTTYSPCVEIYSADEEYALPIEACTTDGEDDAIYDDFGGAEYTFTIPDDAPLGEYQVKLDDHDSKTDFTVEEYRAPEFRIDARTTQNQALEISVRYAYGKPVASGTVEGSVDFKESCTRWFYPPAPLDAAWGKGYWWNGNQYGLAKTHEKDEIDFALDLSTNLTANGTFSIDLSSVSNGLAALNTPGYFELDLTASDPSGKHFEQWLITPTPSVKGPDLCCWLDKAFYSPGETIVVHTAVESRSAPLQLELRNLAATNAPLLRRMELDDAPSIRLEPLPSGVYDVRLADPSGQVSQPFQFAVIGGATTDLTQENPLRLVVEKGLYHTNETARLLIQVDRPGRCVYWFPRAIYGFGFSKPQVFRMDTVSKIVELPLDMEEDKGVIQSAVFTIAEGEPHMAACTIPVLSDELVAGQLELAADKSVYRPGEEVTLDIKTLDAAGDGFHCSVTVTVYNKSLDLLSSCRPARIVDALFAQWLNCTGQEVCARNRYMPWIRSIHPEWVMASLLPNGSLPLSTSFSIPGISSVSFFGGALSIDLSDPLDEEKEDQELRIREDFRDLAYWNATIETDANGCASVSFPMPDGLVEWKIKAWAMHVNYAAEAETSIRCAKDFVAQLNTPRFMVEGDELELSTSVRNHAANAIDCTARCTVGGEGLVLGSTAGCKIENLEAGHATLAYWNTRATTSGQAEVTTTVVGGSESDGMKISFPVLPHGLPKRGGHGGVLAGNRLTKTVEIVIPGTIDPKSLRFQLNTTPDLLEALTGALPFLADYPYGCTEQTLNRFLPSLVVVQTMDELGIEMLPASTNMPPEREAVLDPEEILKRAQAGIDRLKEASDYRGWGWNLDNDSPHDKLVTAWVVRGLHIASKTSGLDVDQADIANSLRNFLDAMDEELADAANSTNQVEISNTDAFQTLVASEIGVKDLFRYSVTPYHELTEEENQKSLAAFTDHLFNHADQLSLYGKILLANACDLQDNAEKRDRLVAFIEQYLERDPKTGMVWLRTGSDGYWYWYNDNIELHAWYLKLLNRIDPHGEKAAGIARHLMQNRVYGDHWKSTRDTAICIEALAEFAKNNPADSPEEALSISLNGKKTTRPEKAKLAPGTNTLIVTSMNGAPVFFDATWQYDSKEDPITAETCDLVSITRSYSRMEDGTNIVIHPGETIQTGEMIEVELVINASQPLEYLLAEDRKPAGFETVETSSGCSGRSYREFHDERVSFYLGWIPKGETVLTYRLRAEHAGKVGALPATVELMYEPRQAANTAENKLRVIRK